MVLVLKARRVGRVSNLCVVLPKAFPELEKCADCIEVVDITGTRHRLKRPVNIIDVGLKADVSTVLASTAERLRVCDGTCRLHALSLAW